MAKPNAYCKLIINRPKLCFGLALGAHVLMIVITGILNVTGYNILPVEFGQVPLDLQEDSTKLQADAWNFAGRDPRVTINPSTLGLQGERAAKFDVLEVVYELEDGNVFSQENLKLIQETEKELFESKVYQDKMCLLEKNGLCKPPLSVVRFFDGSYRAFTPVFNDSNFEKIADVLSTAQLNNRTRPILDYHLAKDAQISRKQAMSPYTRSLFYVGYPFAGFRNTEDRWDEQWEMSQKLSGEAFGDALDQKYKSGVGRMKFYYYLRSLSFDAIIKQVVFDLLLVSGSFVFIFLFMLLQTQSLWITGWGVFGIIACFFSANLIYRVVLDYHYIGIFHVLSVFIILGIGADDVFVFVDTWRASEETKYEDFCARFSDVFRHATGAMFVTSFTTTVAFLVNVSSPLLGVSSFGTFSALLVFVNYCSVVIFFPTVIITYELYWKDWKWPCCKPCGRENEVSVLSAASVKGNDETGGGNTAQTVNNNNNSLRSGSNVTSSDNTDEPANKITLKVCRFFEGHFCDYVVLHRIVRWVLLGVFLAFLALSITYATQLKGDEEQVDIWGPGTNWYSIKRLRDSVFKPSKEDNVIDLYLVWGLENQDRTSCHFTDFKCTGQTVLDRSFDMNAPPCQMAMLDFCSGLKNLPHSKLQELTIRSDAVTGIPEVHCYIEEMTNYLKEEAKNPKYPNGTDFSIPLNSRKIQTLMKYNPQLYNVSRVTDAYYRYFEVALGYWLTHGNTSFSSDDYVTYKNLLGGQVDLTDSSRKPNFQGGKYGNILLYQAVIVRTLMTVGSLGYQKGLKTYDAWEAFMEEEMKKMPVSCANAFQTAPTGLAAWHWLKVQRVLVDSAVRGILLGLCLSLPLLVFMNTNWIVSLLCVFTIGCITVSVVGIIPMLGWKLGVLESLNLTLVVGLAVDYVVHLADGYVRSRHHFRHEKVRDTLGHVGISVLSGACTTLGASVFMFAAKILFFFQFGIFMFCTIGLSILYALFFFTTLLSLVGPEGERGSIVPLLKFIKDRIQGKRSNAVDCDKCQGKGFHEAVVIPRDVNLETL